MTLRDDLEKAVSAATGSVMDRDDWEHLCTCIIRDHGQALLEAVRDAERGRWIIDHAAWIRHDDRTVMEVALPAGVNLSSWGLRRDAIENAMKAIP